MAKKKAVKSSKEKVENEKICAILSYLLIGIIWYFADQKMKKSQFAKFHAKQGIVLFIIDIIIWVIASIPIVGWIAGPILWIIFVILLVVGIINAANGKENKLPIIGGFADNFNF